MKLSSRKQLLEEADKMLSSFRKKAESASVKKDLVIETAKVLYNLKRQNLHEVGEGSIDKLDKSLAALKQVAMKAQRKWEEEQRGLNEDDPKKDYGGYKIKNPESKWALRNLPPTDDPRELQKRKWQENWEKFFEKAPSNWLEATSADTGHNVQRRGDSDIYSTKLGRYWTYEENYLGREFTPDEWERYQRGEGDLIVKGKIPWGWIAAILTALAHGIWLII